MIFRRKGLSAHGFQDLLINKISKIKEKYKWTHIYFYITNFFKALHSLSHAFLSIEYIIWVICSFLSHNMYTY